MIKVVQIKGGNGSGKTTIVKQLLELNGNAITPLTWDIEGSCRTYGMQLHNVGWITIGEYSFDKAMGGTDCYPCTVELIKDAIYNAVHLAHARGDVFGIVFEGMMISTIKSTFYDYLLKLELLYDYVEPLFVILQTTPNGCMNRIANRPSKRTKKPPKFENIAGKSSMVVSHALTYDQKYVRWIDVENTLENHMLTTFLGAVDDVELIAAIMASCIGG